MRNYLAFLLLVFPARSESIKIATWNLAAQSTEQIDELILKGSLKEATQSIDADVYVLQEVLSMDVAKKGARGLGFSGANIVTSNFSVLRHKPHWALETAVISNLPIKNVTELDPWNNSDLYDKGSFVIKNGRKAKQSKAGRTTKAGVSRNRKGGSK